MPHHKIRAAAPPGTDLQHLCIFPRHKSSDVMIQLGREAMSLFVGQQCKLNILLTQSNIAKIQEQGILVAEPCGKIIVKHADEYTFQAGKMMGYQFIKHLSSRDWVIL